MSTRPPRGPRPIRRGAPGPPRPTGIPAATLRRLIYTGAFAAVTAVGAIYGAGLKTQQERQQEVRRIVEAPPEDRVRDLEARRAALLTQRKPLDAKLADLRARMKAQEEEEALFAAAKEKGVVSEVDKTKKPQG
ncbi:hypothetical protein F4821DRAFT_231773 [Hypoxylon rubiginosum]|uniref:Uncharacterized protein n=1 Tax=Hypoxylon rubiginosum TaxID=110542 RepID=A0ACC0D9D2_9PEZI|nr:hypothetical protein F4821DRAFT_231773 [Hypoxylon rubiginosum]